MIPEDFTFDDMEALGRGAKGLRIGLVREGFGIDGTATGVPSSSLSISCGLSDDLPIGMMLTGRHLEASTLIAASQAFESLGDWKTY